MTAQLSRRLPRLMIFTLAALALMALDRTTAGDSEAPSKPARWTTAEPRLSAIQSRRTVSAGGLSALFRIPLDPAIFERVLAEHELRRGPFAGAVLARRMCTEGHTRGKKVSLAIMGGGNFQVKADKRIELVHELRPKAMGALGFGFNGVQKFQIEALGGRRQVKDGVIHETCLLRFTFEKSLAIDVTLAYSWRPPTRLSELPVTVEAEWRGPVAVHEALPAAAKLY